MSQMKLDVSWDIAATVDYVVGRGYKRVTLQFPDSMLADAPLVTRRLQAALQSSDSAAQVRTTALLLMLVLSGVAPCH